MGGNLKYIVALDYEHHIFISEWAKAYPDAKLIGPEGLPEKRYKMKDDKIGSEKWAVIFKKDGKRDIKIDPEFDADFEYEYVDGHANLEIVFFYKPDRVLIQADLMFNLPAKEQYSRVQTEEAAPGLMARIFEGAQTPEGANPRWMKRFNWYLATKDRDSMTESLRIIDGWDWDMMIMCHGDVLETGGKDVFRKVFAWHLQGKKH